jgi:TRAP transporter TAXI family solute receptor
VDAVSTYADIAYLASVGQLEDMAGPFDEVRAIAALPTRELQVVIAPRSPIRSIRDLRGRRVSLGPPGTGVAITAGLLLSAFGIGSHDIRVEHLAFDEAVLPVMNGEIDAAFWGGRFPNPNIAAATRHGARLLQVVGPEIEQFRAEYPFLRATIIPAGTYPGIDQVVHTVGVDGIFVCRADLDERLVYNLTKAFFRAVSTAGRDVRMLRGFNMSRAAATPLPLHPGAARYYREIEMRR